ncbi:MAG: hypothetical protein IJ489_06205 [Clostridia bacterium]|nr:hypothetical protein [Clostridia bacterium]
MSMDLHINAVLISEKGKKIIVRRMISDMGGQGFVYLVDYDGEKKVLKWYKEEYLEELRKRPPLSFGVNGHRRRIGLFRPTSVNVEQAFYDNLCKNTAVWQSGKVPSSWNFVWPQDMTKWDGREDSSFGYIMDWIPSDTYPTVEKFFVFSERFPSREVMLTACLNILRAFENLHNAGYSYQDINEGNIYIRPDTGDILIADTDNVTQDGYGFSIKGTDGYKAPEIWMGEVPSAASDRFSLAIVLFRLMMGSAHPLEGLYSLEMDDPYISQGKDPVFIFDKTDGRNQACREMHRNAMIFWPQYPDYIHALFYHVFSSETIRNKEKRPTEKEWIEALVRLRGEIAGCPYCETLVYAGAGMAVPCPACHQTETVSPCYLRYQTQNIPLTAGRIVYRCQWDADCRDFREPFLKIVKRGTARYFEMLHMSRGDIWTVIYADGTRKRIPYGAYTPFSMGMEIRFGGKSFVVMGEEWY